MQNEKLLRVGTSSWSHESWRGTVYPPDSAPGEFLRHYAGYAPGSADLFLERLGAAGDRLAPAP